MSSIAKKGRISTWTWNSLIMLKLSTDDNWLVISCFCFVYVMNRLDSYVIFKKSTSPLLLFWPRLYQVLPSAVKCLFCCEFPFYNNIGKTPDPEGATPNEETGIARAWINSQEIYFSITSMQGSVSSKDGTWCVISHPLSLLFLSFWKNKVNKYICKFEMVRLVPTGELFRWRCMKNNNVNRGSDALYLQN